MNEYCISMLTFSLLGCFLAINSQALARFAKNCKKTGTFNKKITKKKLWGVKHCNFAYRLNTYFPVIICIILYVLCLVVRIWFVWFDEKINKKNIMNLSLLTLSSLVITILNHKTFQIWSNNALEMFFPPLTGSDCNVLDGTCQHPLAQKQK